MAGKNKSVFKISNCFNRNFYFPKSDKPEKRICLLVRQGEDGKSLLPATYIGPKRPPPQDSEKDRNSDYVAFISCVGQDDPDEYRIINHISAFLTANRCRFPPQSYVTKGGVYISQKSKLKPTGGSGNLRQTAIFCLDVNLKSEEMKNFSEIFHFTWLISSVMVLVVDASSMAKLKKSIRDLGLETEKRPLAVVLFRDWDAKTGEGLRFNSWMEDYKEILLQGDRDHDPTLEAAEFLNEVEKIFREIRVCFMSSRDEIHPQIAEMLYFCQPLYWKEEPVEMYQVNEVIEKYLDVVNGIEPVELDEGGLTIINDDASVTEATVPDPVAMATPPLESPAGPSSVSSGCPSPKPSETSTIVGVDLPSEVQQAFETCCDQYLQDEMKLPPADVESSRKSGLRRCKSKIVRQFPKYDKSEFDAKFEELFNTKFSLFVCNQVDKSSDDEDDGTYKLPRSELPVDPTPVEVNWKANGWSKAVEGNDSDEGVYKVPLSNRPVEAQEQVEKPPIGRNRQGYEDYVVPRPIHRREADNADNSEVDGVREARASANIQDLIRLEFAKVQLSLYEELLSPQGISVSSGSVAIPPSIDNRMKEVNEGIQAGMVGLFKQFSRDIQKIKEMILHCRKEWNSLISAGPLDDDSVAYFMGRTNQKAARHKFQCESEQESLQNFLQRAIDKELQFFQEKNSKLIKEKKKSEQVEVTEPLGDLEEVLVTTTDKYKLMVQAALRNQWYSDMALRSMHDDCVYQLLSSFKPSDGHVVQRVREELEALYPVTKATNSANLKLYEAQKNADIKAAVHTVRTSAQLFDNVDAKTLMEAGLQVFANVTQARDPSIVARYQDEAKVAIAEEVKAVVGAVPDTASIDLNDQGSTTVVHLPAALLPRLRKSLREEVSSNENEGGEG